MFLAPTYSFDVARFDHVASAQRFIVDDSDIGGLKIVKLYDDACDEGIVLRNFKTGGITHWYQTSIDRDVAGDILGWTFSICPEDVRKFPKLKGYKVIVFND